MIRLNYTNMMSSAIGDDGIDAKLLNSARARALAAYDEVEANRGKGFQGWMDLPHCQQLQQLQTYAQEVRANYGAFVVLGIGGSALGSIALFNALKHLYHNELSAAKRNGTPRFYCIDNADPERMNALFDIIDITDTAFCVITKSGATSETMSQYLMIVDTLLRNGCDASKQILCITSSQKGNLIKIANAKNYRTLYIPDGVGGRFSVLSPVGLLPAAVLGIDIDALLKGAAAMDKRCKGDVNTNPALMGALLQILAYEKNHNISVMMPYADKLKYIADWYCQLWAESLGKAVNNQGAVVHVGQTPVKSLGVTDQHSQVQLYAEGPYDKVVTFIEVEQFDSQAKIPATPTDFDDVNFLCGSTLNQLMSAELKATRYALTKQGRMNMSIILPKVDEFALGELLQMFMLQTAYAGALLNIDTYNQPGVEGGKNATYALFGRKGYEQLAKQLSQKSGVNYEV